MQNGLIVIGYSVEGTLARVSAKFCLSLTIVNQILVHGEQTAMGRLRAAMTSRYKERDEDVKIHTLHNLDVSQKYSYIYSSILICLINTKIH